MYSSSVGEDTVLPTLEPGFYVQLKEKVNVTVIHGRLRTSYKMDISPDKVGVVKEVPDEVAHDVLVEFDIIVNDKEKKHEMRVPVSNLKVAGSTDSDDGKKFGEKDEAVVDDEFSFLKYKPCKILKYEPLLSPDSVDGNIELSFLNPSVLRS